MPRRSEPKLGPRTISAESGIKLLQEHMTQGQPLLARPVSKAQYEAWREKALRLLERAFGANTPEVKSFDDIRTWSYSMEDADERFWENERFDHLTRQLTNL